MNLPTELWHLIIECYDLKVYKNCIRVNKIFNKIVNHCLNNIPNEVIIQLDNKPTDNLICEDCKNKCQHTYCKPTSLTNSLDVWHTTKFPLNKTSRTMHPSRDRKIRFLKHDIISSRYFRIDPYKSVYTLPINFILNNKNKTIYMKYENHMESDMLCHWFCYYL